MKTRTIALMSLLLLTGCATNKTGLVSDEDRARLAEKLILSLDAPPEEENLRLWVAEAERRLQELRAGKAKEIPARDVFRRARAAIS
jgi:putative addiction module component (TIGR02574 family)